MRPRAAWRLAALRTSWLVQGGDRRIAASDCPPEQRPHASAASTTSSAKIRRRALRIRRSVTAAACSRTGPSAPALRVERDDRANATHGVRDESFLAASRSCGHSGSSLTAKPSAPRLRSTCARITPRTPQKRRSGVTSTPSRTRNTLLGRAARRAHLRYRASGLRRSSRHRHSACARTCSSRFRCLMPASRGLRPSRVSHQRTDAASGRAPVDGIAARRVASASQFGVGSIAASAAAARHDDLETPR